ncbi:DUF2937 family protein [Thalassotalea psychrophila]|uniref:DUF2937 family protein n=1 Tax=Thalassotalea psychrophila TaxID=3065647 RepID=A0ABY9TZX4_9GAMM|nr:DUF2937 family protein [Colwelliaceae bacterium SQ149]
MLRFICSTFDKILFSVNAVVAMQLPGFIQQYGQRISGHLAEAQYQLQKYQYIADQHYQGDILLLVRRYQMNSDPGINAAGDVVFDLIDRISLLTKHVSHLFESDYFLQIYYFIIELDLEIARATLQDYQLTIPLNIAAIATGIGFAVFVSLISGMTLKIFQRNT